MQCDRKNDKMRTDERERDKWQRENGIKEIEVKRADD